MSQINQLQDELIRLTKVEAQKKAMKMEVEQVSGLILHYTIIFSTVLY